MNKVAEFIFNKPTFGVKWLTGWMVIMGVAFVVFFLFAIFGGNPAPIA